MSGGTTTETSHTEENRDPWAPAQPMLQQILGDSQNLYNSGAGTAVYKGDTTAGLGDTTMSGISAVKANSTPTAGQGYADNFVAGNLASGGMSSVTTDALSKLNGITDPSLSGLSGAVSTLQGTPLASDYLASVARGDMLDPAKGNPYVDGLINDSAHDANQAVKAQYAASGRYGSGSFAAAIANATDKIATQARASEYDKERDRQVAAAAQIDSANLAKNQAGVAGQGSLVSAGQGNSAAAANRATSAAAIGSNAQSFAASLIPQLQTLQGIRDDQANNLLTAGSLEDAARQADLDAQQQKWADEQNAAFKALGLYQATVQPIAGLGYQGTSDTTRTVPTASPFQQIMGGGLGLLSILGKGGLFASDEEIKQDVEKVGELPSGVDLVTYDVKPEYAGGEFGSGKHLGVVAQDVEKVDPTAVVEGPDGLKRVDYAKATGGLLSGPVGLANRGKAAHSSSRPGLMNRRKAA